MDDLVGLTRRCYVLIGLPGSRKSAWRRQVMETWPGQKPLVISGGDMIEQQIAETNTTYKEVFNSESCQSRTETLREMFKQGVFDHRDIILDRTNLTANSRARFLKHLTPCYQRIALVFELPLEDLVTRFNDHTQGINRVIPADVMEAMLRRFQFPVRDEFHRVTRMYPGFIPKAA